MKAIFIKLGGSLITDKQQPYTLRQAAISSMAQQIADARQQHPDVVWFVGNGVGSFGHYAVHESDWQAQRADPQRIAHVRQATSRLTQVVLEALIQQAIPATSLPAASFIYHDGTRRRSTAQALIDYAKNGVVPLVYGDLIYHAREGSEIIPTEDILDILARHWIAAGHSVQTVVYCCNVDGVLDEQGKAIAQLSAASGHYTLEPVPGFDVSGGMAQKVAAGRRALGYCDWVYIVNGLKTDQLKKALNHKAAGTRLVTETAM